MTSNSFEKMYQNISDPWDQTKRGHNDISLNLILNKAERAKITEKARKVGRIKSRKLFVKQLDKYLVK